MHTFAPFAKPLYVMLKPVGSACNLACQYCYYLEKELLYPNNKRSWMSEETLETFIQQYFLAQTQPYVSFTWHGGEPLLRPISFYKKALKLQQKYGKGFYIENSLQTNGTLLTDEWCRFFKENNFLIGLSIDGPATVHDAYRQTLSGKGSFQKVLNGIRLLNKHGVEWNAMAVVNAQNVKDAATFYNFFKSINCHFIQFTPIVERLVPHADGRCLASVNEQTQTMSPLSVTPEEWGAFLCNLFDLWIKEDVGTYYIQMFDATLANWVGQTPGLCTLSKSCGHASAMEHNGDVFACDHFVFPEYKRGNIHTQTITEMMYSPEQLQFGKNKWQSLPRQCKECSFLFACYGECPKNRFAIDAYGNKGLNYLCKGYKRFFAHVAPYMQFMKEQLEKELPPADVMLHLNELSIKTL
jgi:anaerobic sulfatase maturase